MRKLCPYHPLPGRLTDALIEDILRASDEEILEEFREDGGDPDQHAAEMLALFEQSIRRPKDTPHA
jgi:hypothetical protein